MVNKTEFDELEQYDFLDGGYLYEVEQKYFPLIGEFLVSFSELEQELNIAIADYMHDDSHEMGFVIIEKLSTRNKIDLFYKFYIRLESFSGKKHKVVLDKIRKQLIELNTFRNRIVHANWQSLTKSGYVRTRITVDTEEGFVKFIKVIMTPKIIRKKIKEVNSLSNRIEPYKEKAFQF